ncbi:unnamed protein product [Urochloa humidicola]
MATQGSSSQGAESDSPQNSPPIQFPTNISQQLRPNHLQNFHPFGLPSNHGNWMQMQPTPTSFQGGQDNSGQPYNHHPPIFQGPHNHGNWMQMQPTPASFQGGQYNSGHSPNQVFGFAASRSLFGMQYGTSTGAAANSSSHGSESVAPCPTSQKQKEAVSIEELSDSSDEGRRGTRINWTEEANIRLMSSWLNNSVDSVRGNDKKSEHYWRDVAAEFNNNMPSGGHKRTSKQCRTHWDNVKRDVAKFCQLHSKARSTFTSGYSDEMIMETTREWYKARCSKPFTLEYLWRDLKDQPKWRRTLKDGDKNKRNKISESGAYTSSSNQDTEEETVSKEKRPEGQKAAKARQKGKAVAPSPLGDQPSQNMVLFHDAVKTRAAALLKTAEATLISAEAKKEKAQAKKEKARTDKYQAYLKLLGTDTSNFSEARQKRHDDIMDQLAAELAQE